MNSEKNPTEFEFSLLKEWRKFRSFEGHNIPNSIDRTLFCADLIGNACFFLMKEKIIYLVLK